MLLECVRPSTGNVEQYTILSFQKFIFGVYVQYIWYVCVYIHECRVGGQRTALWSRFSTFTFVWILGNQTEVIRLLWQVLDLMSHPLSPMGS